MNPARFTVDRPVLTTMATLIACILGVLSLLRLPIDLMPDVTYPTLTVQTAYQDASPAEMEELVTRPIEEALGAVPGVEEITSVSSEGRSSVRVTFTWGTDLDAAANDLRDRLDRVGDRLPEEADRPTLRKFDLASFPILILGAASELDPVQFRRLMDETVKYRLERVPGVASIDVSGGLEREIHVDLDPDRVKALEIPIDRILSRIQAENLTLPAGQMERGHYEVTLRTPGEFSSVEELRSVPVASRDGVPVLLGDVATVTDSARRVTQIVRVDGKPGIRIAVNKQAGTNTVEVARQVKEEIARINEEVPQVRLSTIIDSSAYIERSIENVAGTGVYGGLLAVAVLLVFLRSVRSTLVIATAIPISVIATFALVHFCGYTLNLMTLGGLALGVGMLVDNSIVVLENVYRLREAGRAPRDAAIEGTGEVAAAVVASTLTTVVVFVPLVFVRGMSGVLFGQLAIVVSFSLLCSIAVALTLVPMLAARFLPAPSPGGLAAALGRPFEWLERGYRDLLGMALSHRALVALLALALLGGTLWLAPKIGTELMPATDEGEVRVEVEMDVGTRPQLVDERFAAIDRIVREEVPELSSSITFIGGTGYRAAGGHTGQMRISLAPLSERERSSEEIASALRKRLSRLPGMRIRTRAGGGLFIMRLVTGGQEQLQIEVLGHDLESADALAAQAKSLVEGLEGVTDARVSRESGTHEEVVRIDRRKAATLGLSVETIARALQTALSGSSAGQYREAGDEFRILVKVAGSERRDLSEILDLTVAGEAGRPVVIRNVVEIEPRRGPVQIERKDQERIVTVSANLGDRDMGSAVREAAERLRSVPRPRGFEVRIAGEYEDQQETFRELTVAFTLALVLVYMVMASLYESLRDPFAVMFSVPFAAVGVVVTLFLTDTTFNVQSFIGCVMLGGIVVNNAILLVDHANLLRRRDGLALGEAIAESGRRRLRPILMTSATTIVGLLPLAIGLGEGGEAQAPMARAVVGGIASSTLITLFVVPAAYSVLASRRVAG